MNSSMSDIQLTRSRSPGYDFQVNYHRMRAKAGSGACVYDAGSRAGFWIIVREVFSNIDFLPLHLGN